MSHLLRLTVLGQPLVELAGRKNIAFVSARSQALLFYLAVSKQIHSREALASLLWPTKPQNLARNNLRDILTKLRPLFGDYFTTTHQTIGFNLTASCWLDADQLEDAVTTFGNINLSQQSSAEDLQTALKLYRGAFLSDFFVEESNEFEAWLIEQREKYRNIALRGFTLLLQRLILQDDVFNATTVAQQLLALEPLHEEGNRQLLKLLGASGQRTRALQHYQQYMQSLNEEVGIEPSEEIASLHLQLLRGESIQLQSSALPSLSSGRLARGTFITPNNLPRSMTPFLGRKDEISAIQERITAPHFSLITIVGEGGMGKSRLALAAAETVMPYFEDGVWFVPLAEIQPGVAAESRISAAIGRAINLPFVSSENFTEQLFAYLRNRKALLILDNFEHLIAAAPFVMDLLHAAPQVQLLVTSRQRLNFQVESIFRLEGLSTPPPEILGESIDEWMEFDSVALFVERAQRVAWRFRLSESNANIISHICRFVEGMPLALELAASLMEKLSVQEIGRRLESDYEILDSPLLDLSSRQQSIRSLLDYSWQFLSLKEQQTLARCSIFVGGFLTDAVEKIAHAEIQTIDLLEQKSLLRRDRNGRFDMHELVRQHAASKLSQQFSDEQEILQRYCHYFSNFIFEREEKLGNDAVTFHELTSELANLQQAWQQAVTRARLPQISQSRQGLFTLYNLLGLSYEAETALRIAIARVRIVLQEGAVDSLQAWQELLAELLIDLANICEVLGKMDEAEELTNEAIHLAEKSHSKRLSARAYLRASANAWAHGDYAQHRQTLNQSIALAQETRQYFIEANALCALGNNDAMHDHHEDALAHYARSLQIAHDHGFRQLENMLVGNAGILHQLRGNFTHALENFLRSLEVSHELGDRYGEALAHANLGALSNIVGQHSKAMEHLSQALATFREIGSQRMEADVLVNLALTHHYQNDQSRAINYCNQAIAIDETQRFSHIVSPAHLNMGRAYEAMGETQAASDQYQKVIDLQSPQDPANDLIVAQAGLARLALKQGDIATALKLIEEIMPRLPNNELYAGPDETAVCLSVYRVLHAAHDERAKSVLRHCAENLRQQMTNIDDATLRQTFVNNVSVRQELVELAKNELAFEFE